MNVHISGVGNAIGRLERRNSSRLWIVPSLMTLSFDRIR